MARTSDATTGRSSRRARAVDEELVRLGFEVERTYLEDMLSGEPEGLARGHEQLYGGRRLGPESEERRDVLDEVLGVVEDDERGAELREMARDLIRAAGGLVRRCEHEAETHARRGAGHPRHRAPARAPRTRPEELHGRWHTRGRAGSCRHRPAPPASRSARLRREARRAHPSRDAGRRRSHAQQASGPSRPAGRTSHAPRRNAAPASNAAQRARTRRASRLRAGAC